MIPVRVCLEGFMSYRERAELFFDGAPIWMLTGSNGAGKSAIFDAITFALYGLHRGGKQQNQELINAHTDQMLVEFDFRLGDDCYRIKRTLTRKDRSTSEVFHLSGPNSPNPRRPGPHALSESGSRDVKSWVERNIGLNDTTFVMSVLLQQGKSERLLDADPVERHRLLSQLVNLSAYERLLQRAKRHQGDADADERDCSRKLAIVEPVDPAEISAVDRELTQIEDQRKAYQAQVEQVIQMKVHAQLWQRLVADEAELRGWLADAQALLEHREQITRDAERLGELQMVVEPLDRILRDSRQRDTYKQRAAERSIDAEQFQQEWSAMDRSRAELEQYLQRIRDQYKLLRQSIEDAGKEQLNLAPHLSRVEELSRVRQEIEELQKQLSLFPADLEQQVRQLQDELDDLVQLRGALPYLEQYVRARQQWFDGDVGAQEAGTRLDGLRQNLTDLSHSLEESNQQIRETQDMVNALQEEATRTRTIYDAAYQQIRRFSEVASQPTCSYCGQPLTPKHLQAERDRLNQVLANAASTAEQAKKSCDAAVERRRECEVRAKRLADRKAHLERLALGTEQERRKADEDRQRAIGDARRALAAIVNHKQYLRGLTQTFSDGPEACFGLEYPTAEDIGELQRRLQGYQALQKRLENRQREAEEKTKRQARYDQASERLHELEEAYPPERVEAVQEQDRKLRQRRRQDEEQLQALTPQLEKDEQRCMAIAAKVQSLKEDCQKAQADASKKSLLAAQIGKTVDERVGDLPDVWRDVISTLTEKKVTELRHEISRLAGVDTKYKDLQVIIGNYESRKQRLDSILKEIDQIPAPARRLVNLLERDEEEARGRVKAADDLYRATVDEKRDLEQRRDQHAELEEKLRTARRRAYLYKQLARLLGPDQLQRHLLQQAEAAIVRYANDMLDHSAAGTLRLELKATQDGEQTSGTPQKAFEVVAYHSETSSDPLPVWLLSGSQRFRVAVGLALGIGQYASQNGRSVESVIIDEGFGSLDKQGRRDMIEALRDLSGVVSRIILVSHQEDLADAFQNRYAVQLVDGTSRVSLVDDM